MVVTGNKTDDAKSASSIRDVARVAGVSHQTVSRVINDHPNVSASTRSRVESAIASMGFRPNAAARSLANGVTDAVTVLTSNTSLYGYAQTLSGIEEGARAGGVRVAVRVLESTHRSDVDAAVEQVSDPRAGGVIVLAFDRLGAAALAALPDTVQSAAAVESLLGRRATDRSARQWAWFDDIAAATEATRHLIELGHRTVHYLAIPSSTSVGDRQRGWRAALQEAGREVPAVVKPSGWTAADAHRAALDLLRDDTVTAVLCGNDDQALGVLRAAHDLGRRVPHDVSIVGFDDVPNAEFFTPALTTVRFDFTALGRRVFELLDIGRRTPTTTEVLIPAPHLVVRESTARPRTRRQARA